MFDKTAAIEKGYFPAEVPPPFEAKDLSEAVTSVPASMYEKPRATQCVKYYIPKSINTKRTISIPNPYSQLHLLDVLEDCWPKVRATIKSSTLSKSRPVVDTRGQRYWAPTLSLSEFLALRATSAPSFRYLVYSDILSYYGNIYTHSIPWALHGKKKAKKTRGDGLSGNRLDKAVRNCMDGQTKGIPIGPDTSLVIAEVVGAAMDELLESELEASSITWEGFRYVDDFCIYVHNEGDARIAQSKIEKVFRCFELEPNSIKTKIVELPELFEQGWVSDLRLFPIRDSAPRQRSDLLSFFNKAFGWFRQLSDYSIVKYALGRLKSVVIEAENWDLFESLLLRSTVAAPLALPSAVQILSAYDLRDYDLDRQKIGHTMEQIVATHAKESGSFEVAWSLWACKCLRLSISETTAREAVGVDNSVVGLIALDLMDKGLAPIDPTKSVWVRGADAGQLEGPHWLLGYEASVRGWLNFGRNIIREDAFFSELEKRDISFYSDSAIQDTDLVATGSDREEGEEDGELLSPEGGEALVGYWW